MSQELELKMTIMRLEEELSLYRNGMSGTELLSIIAEKDKEIEQLQTALVETNEKLRKIAKGSSDVLSKYNTIVAEKTALEGTIASLNESIEKQKTSEEEKDESIVKLQARCAQLIQEKSKEKTDANKKLKEFRDELEKAIKFNTDIKKSVTELTTANASMVAEIATLQNSLELMTAECSMLRSTQLQPQALIDPTDTATAITDTFSTQLQQKDMLLEKERAKCSTYRLEIDSLRNKVAQYEDKIRRHEQYLKSKLLKDRTNLASQTSTAVHQL